MFTASSIQWTVNELYIFVSVVFILLLHEVNSKTLIQFARHGKLKQFSRLFHSPRCQANYDLSCNSVCSPRCSIHLTRKSNETTIGRLSPKNSSAELIVWGALKRIVSSWPYIFHWLHSWPTAIHSWKLVGLMERLCCETHERTLSFPRFLMKTFATYLPKILNFTTDMTSKSVTYRLRYLMIRQRRRAWKHR